MIPACLTMRKPMSSVSWNFVVETLEACEQEAIDRGERFAPLTIRIREAIDGMEAAKVERLSELDDDDDW